MKKAFYYALASALVTAAAIKAAPALAEQPAAADTSISLVRTADLDLASESGRRLLDRRLAHAAREVCGEASDADVEGKNEVRQCRDDALARAAADRDAVLAAASRGALIAVSASR